MLKSLNHLKFKGTSEKLKYLLTNIEINKHKVKNIKHNKKQQKCQTKSIYYEK